MKKIIIDFRKIINELEISFNYVIHMQDFYKSQIKKLKNEIKKLKIQVRGEIE